VLALCSLPHLPPCFPLPPSLPLPSLQSSVSVAATLLTESLIIPIVPVPVRGVRAFPVGPDREGRGEPRMRLPKQRGGLPLLPTRSRQPGARYTPRRPQDSDGPVPVRGVRAFPVGPDREGRGEPRMRLPKQRGGLPLSAADSVTAASRAAHPAAAAGLGWAGTSARCACVSRRPRSGGEGRTEDAPTQAAWRPHSAADSVTAARLSQSRGTPRGGRRTRMGRYRCAVCVRFPSAPIGRGGQDRGWAYPSSVAASHCCRLGHDSHYRRAADPAAAARLGWAGTGARCACVSRRPRSGGEGRTEDGPTQAAWRPPSAAEWVTAARRAADQLPDLAVGLGRRDDAGIGHTARPLPIAVADSPIEAASPDQQQPMCFLE
jgi:hypothetical protein